MQSLMLRFIFFGFLGSQLHIALCAASAAEAESEMVTLDAKPEPIPIDPGRSAVIVIDMENDFAAKGGMFDRAGVDISGAQKAIPPTAKALAAARQAGLKIIYLKMGYRPDLSDLGTTDSVNRTRHLKFGVGQKIQAPERTRKPVVDPRHLGHRHRSRTETAVQRHCYLQDAVQRFLPNRSRHYAEKVQD